MHSLPWRSWCRRRRGRPRRLVRAARIVRPAAPAAHRNQGRQHRVERQQRNQLQRCLTRLADGDRTAFRPLFDLVWPRVREIAGRMMPHASDADDAAQTCLLKVFDRASEFDPERDALAWIVGIVSYECLTLRRKTTRRRESGGDALGSIVDGGTNPEERLIAT